MTRNVGGNHDQVDRPFAPDELDDVNHKVNRIVRQRMRKKRKFFNFKATKICTAMCRFNIIRTTAKKYGMVEVPEFHDWDVYWTDVFPSLERCRFMKRYQKINHFPGMLEICRKDTLARNLHHMLKLFPKEYNFFPKTWCLPEDSLDIIEYAKNNPDKMFILKPCRGSEGRGISITRNPKHFRAKFNMIGQVYINKPLLIGGFKFDFRLYALVTSCDPLRIYVYNEGLARFATKKYEPTRFNLNQRFMHLTNYSVNKRSEDFIIDDDEGSKRKLSTINEWFVKEGYDVEKIWSTIDDIIVKTLLIVLPKLKYYYHLCFQHHVDTLACFEILGFDFILDNHLKPYLLEVNYTPSFNRNTPVDRRVKDALLSDVFKLINLNRNEKLRINEAEKNQNIAANRYQKRVTAKWKAKCERVLKATAQWEDAHKGNFRKIYPSADSGKYKHFLKVKKNQIYPKTFQPLITEEDYDKEKEHNIKEASEPRKNPFIDESVIQTVNSQVDGKLKRDFLLRSHSLIEDMYQNLKQSGKNRMELEIALSRENRWDVEDRYTEEYQKHKEKFTSGIVSVLKTISSKPEIPLPVKEELSSIFLNPSLPQNGNKKSHIGPIGPVVDDVEKVEKDEVPSDEEMELGPEKMFSTVWAAPLFDHYT